MKLFKSYSPSEYWVPDSEKVLNDIVYEWNTKGELVLNACKKKEYFLQAGGHVGVFPIQLARYFTKVVTFEPWRENFDCLARNIDQREISNIDRYCAGLGQVTGCASLVRQKEGNTGSTQIKPTEEGSVAITTIDILNMKGLDLLWLDIEGMELQALEGGRNTIEKFQPLIVLENNGLIFSGKFIPEGEPELEEYMLEKFNYKKVTRLMRDDVYAAI